MFQGILMGIFLAQRKGEHRLSADQAEAVPSGGLKGDRYFRQGGNGKPDQEITLIENEALEALARESSSRGEHADSRVKAAAR